MSISGQQNCGATAIAENTDALLNWGNGNDVRTCPPPRYRRKKILAIRQQLREGKYDIDRRLNVVLDRLLEELVV